jgi:hypothetical protein
MRQWLTAVLVASSVILGLGLSVARAQTFSSGSTGADGAFSPTANVTLTLPPNGVFNYTTVNVPSGVTVKFTKNATNTPVTILATGNVTIAGTIDISGAGGTTQNTSATAVGITAGAGGPGGFDGGNGATGTVSTTGGTGRGPGGGTGGTGTSGGAGGGGFAAAGGNGGAAAGSTAGVGGAAYSDATLLPLIGGSGGGGGGSVLGKTGGGGGGGGGAILIASSGTLTLTGSILATGGWAAGPWNSTPGLGGAGSGGAVRLIATTLTGTGGTINLAGAGSASAGSNVGGAGSAGRLRTEAFTNTLSATITGAIGPSVSSGSPTSVTLPNAPTLQITSVGGVAVPANPTGSLLAPDVVLPGTTANPVTVNISAANVPVGTVLAVTVVGFMGASTSTSSTALSGTLGASTATASVTVPTNEPALISVSATFAIAALDGSGPYYADGEPVDRVRVTAHTGGRGTLALITRSGREVPVPAR